MGAGKGAKLTKLTLSIGVLGGGGKSHARHAESQRKSFVFSEAIFGAAGRESPRIGSGTGLAPQNVARVTSVTRNRRASAPATGMRERPGADPCQPCGADDLKEPDERPVPRVAARMAGQILHVSNNRPICLDGLDSLELPAVR
jgi:hypothetical protein